MNKKIKFGIIAAIVLIFAAISNPLSINDATERQVVQTLGWDNNNLTNKIQNLLKKGGFID